MGMVVRSNIMALNANRQLGMNNSQVSKSLEKLSSGFKINRAGDDASGLAISEKMKAQIKGLETASANSQDGISLVQTAEGALTEVHDMLNRMVELAGKAANGTIDSETDRAALQKEMDSLLDEIDRIAQGTNFNGISLLDGSLGGKIANVTKVDGTAGTAGSAANTTFDLDLAGLSLNSNLDAGESVEIDIGGTKITLTGKTTTGTADTDLAGIFDGETVQIDGKNYSVSASGTKLTFTSDDQEAPSVDLNGKSITVSVSGGSASNAVQGTLTSDKVQNWTPGSDGSAVPTKAKTEIDFTGMTAKDFLGASLKVGNIEYTFTTEAATGNEIQISESDNLSDILNAIQTKVDADSALDDFTVSVSGNKLTIEETSATGTTKAVDASFQGFGGLTLQIGDTGDAYNKLTVSIGDMSATGLGIDGLRGDGIMNQDAAMAALDLVKKGSTSAINTVSSQRAALGAMQNRLEHTINNLDVATENMEAANSRIRDTDMAKEMMEYTKQNVLTQAAQAMLAQANQQPQSILQLLQ